jgi:hypothetical protein
MKEIYSALIGVLVGSIITVSAQYFISYGMIEKPRIELEQRKVFLEAQRQLSSLMPNIDKECSTIKISKYNHHFVCEYENHGQHLADIKIDEIEVSSILTIKKFILNKDFKVVYKPENKNKFRSFPGSKSILEFDIILNKTSIPNRYINASLLAVVSSRFQASDAELKILIEKFPELEGSAQELGGRGMNYEISFTDSTDSINDSESTQ